VRLGHRSGGQRGDVRLERLALVGGSRQTYGSADSERVSLAKRCFDAWNRGDVGGVVANYHADVVFDGSGYGEGVYVGREAVRRHFEEVFESLVFRNEIEAIREVDGDVLVHVRLIGAG
jgi:ketosteroid isomerase-like protein